MNAEFQPRSTMILIPQQAAAAAESAAAQNGESPKRNVELAFYIRDKVTVIELERPGVVISIHLTNDGDKYEVRYFWDGCAKEVYFYRWELAPRHV
jgi:hypothetical protein